MLKEGYIFYFTPFYFKNGNTAKPKYGLILKDLGDTSIILSLPTRNDHIPSIFELTKDMECIELPEISQNCFFFSTIKEVTECGKKFDFNTFLYGHQLDFYEKQKLRKLYPNEGGKGDYVIWGKVKPNIFGQIIQCFKNSKSVKRKFKKLL